jgi:hypothetical protein
LAACAGLAATLALVGAAQGQGIPEPSLIMYGVVSDSSAGGSRVSFGTLSWTFQPPGGAAPIALTGTLTNINDQFSYALRVPCETEIPGVAISPGALKLSASPTTYDRSKVSVNGIPASFSVTAQTNLTLSSTDRGRIERIDLTVNLNSGGGLPDAWQLQYFGHTGVDPNADPDHDGMSNWAEYIAGTNPTDAQSRFAFVRVFPDPQGGFRVEWSSVQGKFYTLQRSNDLLQGFSDLQTHIAATAPANSFRDGSASGTGPQFYRLEVEP